MIDFSKVKQSLKHLQLQFDNYQTMDATLPILTQEAIAESVIQRFETNYDCLWKVLKRYLTEELGLVDIPNSPKPVFRLANENNLLSSNIEKWIAYANARIATAHDYNGKKARDTLELIAEYLVDATELYHKLSQQNK